MKKEIFQSIWSLRRDCETAYLSYVDKGGCLTVHDMMVLEHDKIGTQYFSTNTSSGKITALRGNSNAAVYYCDPDIFRSVLFIDDMEVCADAGNKCDADNLQGALFIGDIEVCTDAETKGFLWREGFEIYYPKGVTDPDYCVLKLTVRHGSYFHGRCNTDFFPDELDQKSIGHMKEGNI